MYNFLLLIANVCNKVFQNEKKKTAILLKIYKMFLAYMYSYHNNISLYVLSAQQHNLHYSSNHGAQRMFFQGLLINQTVKFCNIRNKM